jgi:hypothetical protein
MSESPSHAQVNTRTSKDPQHPQGAIEGTSARGSAPQYLHSFLSAFKLEGGGKKGSSAASSNLQHPQGATEGTSARGNAPHQPSARRPSQASGYGSSWISKYILPEPASPKDKYQILMEEHNRTRDELRQARATIKRYDRELEETTKELRLANQNVQLRTSKHIKFDISGLHIF